jgi:hypothetical protein
MEVKRLPQTTGGKDEPNIVMSVKGIDVASFYDFSIVF